MQVGLAVAGLLALVAVVAAGRHGGSTRGSAPSQAFFGYLVSAFLVFMTVGTVALVYLLVRESDAARGARNPALQRRKTIATLIIILGLATLLVSARELGLRPSFLHHGAVQHALVTHAPGPTSRAVPPAAVHSPRFRWLAATLVGGLFLALVVIAAWATARSRVAFEDRREAAEEVADALDSSVDDLRAEPDARRAIIAAYARMERALGAVGVRRQPSEAPLEYLARALEGLRASGASVHRLTELFRVAKFSAHPLGAADKESAIDALVTVRDELRAEA